MVVTPKSLSKIIDIPTHTLVVQSLILASPKLHQKVYNKKLSLRSGCLLSKGVAIRIASISHRLFETANL